MQAAGFPEEKCMEFPFWVSYVKLNLTDGNKMKACALNILLTSGENEGFWNVEGQRQVLRWKPEGASEKGGEIERRLQCFWLTARTLLQAACWFLRIAPPFIHTPFRSRGRRNVHPWCRPKGSEELSHTGHAVFCCCSVAQSRSAPCDPIEVECQAPVSSAMSRYLPRFMSIESVMIESVMLFNHLILRHLLLLPSTFPSIRVFSTELALHIRWPKN